MDGKRVPYLLAASVGEGQAKLDTVRLCELRGELVGDGPVNREPSPQSPRGTVCADLDDRGHTVVSID